jgi:16S rRNA G527 N7-methylase RsmG
MTRPQSVSRETLLEQSGLPERIWPELLQLAAWLRDSALPLGLTNFHTAADILQHAMLPARAALSLVPAGLAGPCAELGPGSGALGLSLALLAPAAHFSLVDRRRKVVSFLDVTVARLGIANATAELSNLSREPSLSGYRWTGVCLRAFARPSGALSIAAVHARHWILVFHSEGMAGYDADPAGFRLTARARTTSPGLAASLYVRKAGP